MSFLMLALLLLPGLANANQNPGLVTRVVGQGEPIVLIPGLTCAGEVWDETIASLGQDHEYHVITLPGFAGNAPLEDHEGKFLEKMRDLVIAYIEKEHLEKPVIIGHSLGGFVALNIAIQKPDLPSKLVIVDSLPFLTAIQMPGTTAEAAKGFAANMKAQMIGSADQPAESRIAFQRQMLQTMIIDSAHIEKALQWGMDSDAETVAQAMYELYTTDIRDELDKIQVPTLVLGAWIAYQNYGVTRESNMTNYKAQYAKLKDVTVDMTDKGNHFIMWDDPEFFQDWLAKFL